MIAHTPDRSTPAAVRAGLASIAACCTFASAASAQVPAAQPDPSAPAVPAAAGEAVEPADAPAAPEAQSGANDGAATDSVTSPLNPEPPTTVPNQLANIRPGLALKRKFDEIAARANLRLGLANTYLLQQASGGPGERTAAAGDLDVLAKWTAIGAGTPDTGILAFAAETRYQIGHLTPSELGSEIGTLIPTTNGFGERHFTIKELYWDQRLFDDHFRFALGRVDPENLFGGHRLQNANTFFLNKAFSGNPAVAYPGAGCFAAAQVKPVKWLYFTAGLTDANGVVTESNIEGFFEDDEFLTFGEAGVTPTIDGLGAGRYRLAFWHIDEREDARVPSDQGITLSFDQDIGEDVTAFLRYGHSDGEAIRVADSVQGGVGIKGVFGKDHMLGLAAAWSQPADSDLRDEKVVEVFQRFQLTETMQFTVGAEAIFDPSNAPDDDVLGVFSARFRLSF